MLFHRAVPYCGVTALFLFKDPPCKPQCGAAASNARSNVLGGKGEGIPKGEPPQEVKQPCSVKEVARYSSVVGLLWGCPFCSSKVVNISNSTEKKQSKMSCQSALSFIQYILIYSLLCCGREDTLRGEREEHRTKPFLKKRSGATNISLA